MATSDVQLTVLGLINKVKRRMGINTVSSLSSSSDNHTLMTLDLLNEVIMEVSDYGDWQEMYRSVLIPVSAGQTTYKVSASSEIKNVLEIAHSSRGISPLQPVDIPDIRRLQRLGTQGVPNQFSMIGVSGSRPKFAPYPVPGSNEAGTYFDVAFYKKPRLYTTSDGSSVVTFPSGVIYLGLYAKMLAEEAGGESNAQYQTAFAEYLRARKEALNRYTSDSSTFFQIVPEM